MKPAFILILTIFLNLTLSAQDGTPDLTFNPNDIGHRNGFGPYNTVVDPSTYFSKVAVQADGKILCSGQFTQYNGTTCSTLIRLTADGLYDTTFNTGGSGLAGTVNAIIIQPNGKILIGGELYSYNGTSIQNVIRLNADGSLDSSFTVTVGQGNLYTVYALALRADSKLYIAGKFDNTTIVRVDANGAIDNTFTCLVNAFIAQGNIYSLGLQSDGKIIVGGGFTSYGTTSRNRILRLNTDGSLDTSFDPGTGASAVVRKVIVLPDDKILMMGDFNSYNQNYDTSLIARLNSNGLLDTTFTPGFFRIDLGVLGVINSMIVQPDGKILLGGAFNFHGATPIFANATSVINMARLNANGTRDTTLSPIGTDDAIYDLAMQGNTNFIVAGNFETYANVARRRITRSLPNGTNDMTFNTGSGSNSTVYDMKVLSDGKMLIAGNFRLYNGVVRNRIARLNADGTLDTTLNSNLLIDGPIYTFKVQTDGKILIGGSFSKVGAASRNLVARLNADFSLDTSFNIGTGFSPNRVLDIAVQSNGKIIVVGYFTTFNGVTCNGVARLNANGTLDTTFNVGTAANFSISTVLVQSDGKIILFGGFSSFNGVSKRGIVRLNSNGSIDTTFITGTGLIGTVKCATELPDGKILFSGSLNTYNSINTSPMMRLNPDGTKDTTFSMNSNTTTNIENFVLQPDGKIIIGGTTFPTGIRNVGKLSANGATDGTFNFNTHLGPNGPVYCVGLQTDGKIIIGGSFDTFDTVGRNCIARLNNTASLSVDDYTNASSDIAVYTENNTLRIATKENPLQSVSVYDLNGKLLYENQHISDSNFVIESIQRSNQLLLFKFVDQQGKRSGLKTIF
ncbi:hypothetical protein [Flavobacterium sp.]|uniref:hypothetical protein n=1 Tax=Flavobacterium sp. TaxID=239 RepID=UPI00262BBD39|nr:hypothetical protein [Flavobacterium sp.]